MDFLKKTIEKQLRELMEEGSIAECRDLNQAMPQNDEKYQLDDKALPMHFSGDLRSNVVFVELNPGRPSKGDPRPTITKEGLVLDKSGMYPPPVISDVASYIKHYENFGTFKAKCHELRNEPLSKFDRKQLNFFSGFEGRAIGKKEFTLSDVAKVRNEKLQLEIVPFMSSRFRFKNFSDDYIYTRIEIIKKIIRSEKREYVFVTGSDRNISRYFEATTPQKYQIPGFKNGVYVGVELIDNTKYCFLATYKAQGFDGNPMQEYGKLCRKLLNNLSPKQ